DADARFAAFAAGEDVVHGAFGELVRCPNAAAPSIEVPEPPPAADAAECAPVLPAPSLVVAPPIDIPDSLPLALGAPLEPLTASATDAAPYPSPRAHVDALLDIVTLRTARAIAEAWSSGRLSVPAEDARPFEREVMAIVGQAAAPDELVADLSRRLAEAEHDVARRVRATIAAGLALPFVDLGRELGLSPIACEVLMIVLAPQLRGEIARLYGVLANDEHRPLVDRCLVETIIAGTDARVRGLVADELAGEAPLIRFGAVRSAGAGLFAALAVDAVVLDRARGRDVIEVDGATALRGATRSLDELRMPCALVRDIVTALAAPRSSSEPVRVVLRGRRGAGRHTLVATLAAKVGYRVAAIDASRLGREPQRFAAQLALELVRARLRRAVPVVSNLETIGADDAELRDHIEQVLRAHPGPIVLRVAPETTTLPLAPGYLTFAIPALSEAERASAWQASLARAGVTVTGIESLADKFRIGPGTIEQIVQEHVRAPQPGDVTAHLETLARQHLAARLSHVATLVTRLASWEQVALPDDLRDSLKELVGRIRHRKTVFEAWGYDAKMTTSRGVTALFYGPPGTGKSMVAGLIARELGLELYRVDLARVVSKWIGETEKNLAEVFDAAEAGQAVILFDEADSLFAKRTEV
ncbi:MAG TPA: ATP-binding protein, partial [Kofleriaceae bacterium]|nr:ATP-binding protein [Kofleriaceae bacterium]